MPPENIKIVIDSCVLIYSVDENTKESTKIILERFSKNRNRLTYSSISAFEVLKNRQENQNESDYSELLNNLYRIPIDTPVLNSASTLYFLYKQTNKIQKIKLKARLIQVYIII
jgi:predicted nucleic acid-binding protein